MVGYYLEFSCSKTVWRKIRVSAYNTFPNPCASSRSVYPEIEILGKIIDSFYKSLSKMLFFINYFSNID